MQRRVGPAGGPLRRALCRYRVTGGVPPGRPMSSLYTWFTVGNMNKSIARLRKWRELDKTRNQDIVQARKDGITWAEIEDATGMNRMALHLAAKKENGGVLPEGNPRFKQP